MSFSTACWRAGRKKEKLGRGLVEGALRGDSEAVVREAGVVSVFDDEDISVAVMAMRNVDSVDRVFSTAQVGQPRVEHQSSSSLSRHCKKRNALLPSPLNASSRSSGEIEQSAACARAVARL